MLGNLEYIEPDFGSCGLENLVSFSMILVYHILLNISGSR